MSLVAQYRVVKFPYKQFVTMQLPLRHTCTTLAVSANELEGVNDGSLLIPTRFDFFKALKLPAIAGDAPITKSTLHVCQSPRPCYSQVLPPGIYARLRGVIWRSLILTAEYRNTHIIGAWLPLVLARSCRT
jgi:hypothetical protein